MSERILIDIAVDEFEFVKAAIAFKARYLISYLDDCKKNAEKPDAVISHFVEVKKTYSPHTSKRRGRPPLNKTAKRKSK